MRRLAALAVVAVFAVAACSGGSKDEGSGTTSTTVPAAPPTAPLTGLPDPDGAAATRPALWVKVANDTYGAQPQTGVEHADVVYEEIAEGTTRFAVAFNSTVPERVGPVRSVRPMDADLVQPLLGIFAYSGGASGPVESIQAVSGLHTVDESSAGEAMTRSSDRQAPHNLYGLGPALFGLGGEPVPPPPLFEYLGDGEAFPGAAVTSFTVGFSDVEGGVIPTWTWDAAAGAFLRSQPDGAQRSTDGDQLSATNVVVQFIEYPDASEGVTVGSGEAWIFSQGALIKGRWERPGVGDVTRYTDAAGAAIALTPGRTWVSLPAVGDAVEVVTPPPSSSAPPSS